MVPSPSLSMPSLHCGACEPAPPFFDEHEAAVVAATIDAHRSQ